MTRSANRMRKAQAKKAGSDLDGPLAKIAESVGQLQKLAGQSKELTYKLDEVNGVLVSLDDILRSVKEEQLRQRYTTLWLLSKLTSTDITTLHQLEGVARDNFNKQKEPSSGT